MAKNGSPWDDDDEGRGNRRRPDPFSRQNKSGDDPFETFKSELNSRVKDFFSKGGKPPSSGSGGPGVPGGTWVFKAGLLAVLGLWLSSGFYRVQEGELGVVLRFGRSIDLTQAGWHYRFPAPVDQVIIQKVASVNSINSRISVDPNGEGSTPDSPEGEATLILTGDENMVHTSYTVLWKIKDVNEFLFTARRPEETIRVAAESVVREVIGQSTARSALTEGREDIGVRAQEILQRLMDQYKVGVQIVSVQLQSVAPPGPVIEAFNDVQASLVDADRSRNEAKAYESDIIPRAEGQAIQIINDAEAYRQRVIAQAEGEVAQFQKVLESYQSSPVLFTNRQYILTMEEILPKLDKVLVDDKIGSNFLPHMAMPGLKPKVPQAKEEGAR